MEGQSCSTNYFGLQGGFPPGTPVSTHENLIDYYLNILNTYYE